ncbi:MAG TPA: sterol desaturase family protein [Candidatus Obscuribacterales bacterium]
MNNLTILTSLLAGVLSWSFAEYALHAWVGHRARGRNVFSREHLRHHSQKGFFSPTSKKALAAVPVLSTMTGVGSLVFGPAGLAYALGFGLTYLGYELLHLRLHTHGPRGPLGAWLRRHHFYHHFHNPWMNQGVTSPLWDLILGTHASADGPIRVPAQHALDWMLDENGAIKAVFAKDYQLFRAGSKG